MFVIFKDFITIFMRIMVLGLIVGIIFSFIPYRLILKLKIPSYSFEKNNFYERYFHISKWKDQLPQFSNITKMGFKKDSIRSLSSDYLDMFYLETIRAEITHIFLMAISPVYLIGKYALPVKIFMTAANFVGNIPFIMVQRYNRPRIKALKEKIILKI